MKLYLIILLVYCPFVCVAGFKSDSAIFGDATTTTTMDNLGNYKQTNIITHSSVLIGTNSHFMFIDLYQSQFDFYTNTFAWIRTNGNYFYTTNGGDVYSSSTINAGSNIVAGGQFTGNGAGLTNLNVSTGTGLLPAGTVASLAAPADGWLLGSSNSLRNWTRDAGLATNLQSSQLAGAVPATLLNLSGATNYANSAGLAATNLVSATALALTNNGNLAVQVYSTNIYGWNTNNTQFFTNLLAPAAGLYEVKFDGCVSNAAAAGSFNFSFYWFNDSPQNYNAVVYPSGHSIAAKAEYSGTTMFISTLNSPIYGQLICSGVTGTTPLGLNIHIHIYYLGPNTP